MSDSRLRSELYSSWYFTFLVTQLEELYSDTHIIDLPYEISLLVTWLYVSPFFLCRIPDVGQSSQRSVSTEIAEFEWGPESKQVGLPSPFPTRSIKWINCEQKLNLLIEIVLEFSLLQRIFLIRYANVVWIRKVYSNRITKFDYCVTLSFSMQQGNQNTLNGHSWRPIWK